MVEQCKVCGEGLVTQIEESVVYYIITVTLPCGSDYATTGQVSYNLSLNKEPPSDAQ